MRFEGSGSIEEAHADAMAKGAKCLDCPFYGSRQGPVPSDIRPGSRLVVIGEAPTGHEVDMGENLQGRHGQVLDMALKESGLSRRHISFINSTLCSPTGNKGIMKVFLQKQSVRYTKANRDARRLAKAEGRKHVNLPRPLTPQQACLPRFRRELAQAQGKVILTLGTLALRAVGGAYLIPVGKSKLEARGDLRLATLDKQAGHPFELPETTFREDAVLPARTLCAAQHPLVILNGDPSASKMTLDHMALAGRIAVAGGWEWPDAAEIVIPEAKVERTETVVLVPREETAAQKKKRLARNDGAPYVPKMVETTVVDEQVTYEAPSSFFPRMEAFVEEWVAAGCPNPTVDIETAGVEWKSHVRCIGFGYGPKWEERVIIVPLRFTSGELYWTREFGPRVKKLLQTMLNSARIGGQNFIFDSRHLIRMGLMKDDPVERVIWFDTMLAYKNTREGNLRRGLAAITTRFIRGKGPRGLPLAVRLWKGDVDHKATENTQKDADLWWYCHEDVKAQMRCRAPSMEWVRRDKTEPQFMEDLRLQPILRNMGELGVLVHEPTRLDNADTLAVLVNRAEAEIKRVVGDASFKPSSPQQVAEWLYATMGYDPPLNTAGKKWFEGDGMATSIPALMQLEDLWDKEANPKLHEFTNAQIRYKSLSKLQQGFIDTLTQHEISPDFPGYRLIHANFKTTILSGRYGCSPNLMNWPKRAFINMRQMIHAAPGHVLVSADLDQAELRALIVAAGDPMLQEAIEKGQDPHTLNAASLMAKNEDELFATYDRLMAWLALGKKRPSGPNNSPVVKAWLASPDGQHYTIAANARMLAKIYYFSVSYGAWMDTLYSHMATFRDKASGDRIFANYSREDNQRYYEMFHRWRPSYRKWHAAKNDEARRTGWISDLYKFRKIPFVYGVQNENDPPNREIQTSISRQMNLAIQRIADLIPFRGWSRHTGIVLQVHDELVVQVPENMVDRSIKILEDEMPSVIKGMRIGCEAGASKVWTGKSYIPME